jgi:type II secretory pathway pseudopilin PulG
MARWRHPSRGFTYVGLIIVVAIIALVAATTIKLGVLLQRRAAEEDLLEVGAAFADALKSYADASLPGQSRQPASVAELLRDPRFPNVRRHLRKLYLDPVTGSSTWGVMRSLDQVGIIGFYSLSEAMPIKQSNFAERFQQFDHKQHLSEWKFMGTGLQDIRMGPGTPPVQNAPAQPAGAPDAPAAPAAAPFAPVQDAPLAPAPQVAPDVPPADVAPPAEPPAPEVSPATRQDPPAASTDEASQPGVPKAVKKR